MDDPTSWSTGMDTLKVGDAFTEEWLDRFRALMLAYNEERQEHRATLAYAARMREALQAFVDANDKGPATEWLQRVFECDKLARAALKDSPPSTFSSEKP